MQIRTGLLLAALSFSALAQAAEVKVEGAWVRPAVPGQKVVGAFMTLTADADMTLVKAASPVARVVELHFMRMADGMMEMRELEQIELPKGTPVSLEPGGMHVMLIGLKAPIKVGDKVLLTLTLKDAKGGGKTLPVILQARAYGD